jgi:protein TonB
VSGVAETFRVPARRRAAGFAAAIALELLLVLALLTLGGKKMADMAEQQPRTLTFDVAPEAPVEPTKQPAESRSSAPAAEPSTEPLPVRDPQPQPQRAPVAAQPSTEPLPPPLLELPRGSMATADIRALPGPPAPPARRAAGPPSDGTGADTEVVGTAPNGERLYAAAWYRKPYDEELRGYLSTASGPGWALIACRTVPDFRVDDCVALDEYPSGSRMARAVLAAAWQFRVRPPQSGGQLKVGEWVRIRIDYTTRRSG